MSTWRLGPWTATRVQDPGFELILPSDPAVLRRSPWLHPQWVTDDWQLRVGSSLLLLQGPGPTTVVDPWLAFDDPTRFEERLASLPVAPADVDLVVNSHIDGIGANVAPDTLRPAFPNARYLVPAAELEAATGEGSPVSEGWQALVDAGVVDPVGGPLELADALLIEELPGHNAGHIGVRVGPEGTQAVIVGHLFLHPAQVANTANARGEADVALLQATREALLRRCALDGTVLIGPLFAAPGGGRVVESGIGGWALA